MKRKWFKEQKNKIQVKPFENFHLFCVVYYKILQMIRVSTTNDAKDTFMMDENEIENSVSERHSIMIQIIMSQKKAKSKVITESKRPLFWLGFEAINWISREKDYSINNTKFLSELIKKGMKIE